MIYFYFFPQKEKKRIPRETSFHSAPPRCSEESPNISYIFSA